MPPADHPDHIVILDGKAIAAWIAFLLSALALAIAYFGALPTLAAIGAGSVVACVAILIAAWRASDPTRHWEA